MLTTVSVLAAILALACLALGIVVAALLLQRAAERERAAQRAERDAAIAKAKTEAIAAAKAEMEHAIEVAKAEYLDHALGMVRNITQVRGATPVSLTPKLDAIEAEKAAFDLSRYKENALASDKRFNKEMDK